MQTPPDTAPLLHREMAAVSVQSDTFVCYVDLWSVDEHSRSRRSGSSKMFRPRRSSTVMKHFVTGEDPRGRSVLLEPDLQLRECSSTLHKSARQCSMSL